MKPVQMVLLAVICAGLMGTTYIIKEGGKEVGRYDEKDGKTETMEMNNEKPIPAAPKPKKAVPPPQAAVKSASADPAREALRAQAEKLVAGMKAKNDSRRAEVEQAIKEMEGPQK